MEQRRLKIQNLCWVQWCCGFWSPWSPLCLCTPLAPDKVEWNSQAEYVASTALLKCRSELILKPQLVHHQCCLCTSLCWSVDLGKAPEHTQGQQPSQAQLPTENEAPWLCQGGVDPGRAVCATHTLPSSTGRERILLSVILEAREGGPQLGC